MILVVDARGQSHSIAALLHGFSTFDQSVRIAGVILNRVGSPRHEEVLRQACEHAGVPVFGAIPRADELSVPSRHLGLITAVEHGEQARAAVDAMIELVGRHVDVIGHRRRGGQSDDRRSRGTRPSPRPQPRTSPSRWRQVRRSASATPNTANCCAPQGPRSSSSTR